MDKEALDAQVRERREREAREEAEARAAAQQAVLYKGCLLGKAAAAQQARRDEERRIAAYRQQQEVREKGHPFLVRGLNTRVDSWCRRWAGSPPPPSTHS